MSDVAEQEVHASFTNSVKELVSGTGARVKETVRNFLVNKEIDRRVDLILKGIEMRDDLIAQTKRVKPDVIGVVDDGTPKGKEEARWSQAKWKEKTDLDERLKKVCKALDSALADTPDYDPLKKVFEKCGGGEKKCDKNQCDKGSCENK